MLAEVKLVLSNFEATFEQVASWGQLRDIYEKVISSLIMDPTI